MIVQNGEVLCGYSSPPIGYLSFLSCFFTPSGVIGLSMKPTL
ncbi:hypothetical protein SAMN02910436_01031 [Ruminococcaceae bacterium P7]|nr:hypothetical protein SAMN02910436_01031 [Ruminococcaceae bacterium P7]